MERSPEVRITKQFDFEAAHILWGYDGRCKNIHGHSYMLYVTIIGKPIEDHKNPKFGMVMDFSELKSIVNETSIKPLDHSLMIMENTPVHKSIKTSNLINKIVSLPYQPTCENMIVDFAHKIKSKLPNNIRLHSLRLHETSTAYAEWHASDNTSID